MITTLLAAALLTLVRDAPASSEERQGAIHAHVECLLAAARTFDDGVSDASTVGRVIQGSCVRERDRVSEVATRGLRRGLREAFLRTSGPHDATLAVQAVLANRAAAMRAAAQ